MVDVIEPNQTKPTDKILLSPEYTLSDTKGNIGEPSSNLGRGSLSFT